MTTRWDEIARELGFRDEKSLLLGLYETNSIEGIAAMLNCGKATVQRRMALHGIKKRGRGGPQLKSYARYKCFHVDQRILFAYGLTIAAAKIGVSTSTLYNYKQWKKEALSNAVLYNIARLRATEMGDAQQSAPSSEPCDEPLIPTVLPETR
jgi:hypothetical protein